MSSEPKSKSSPLPKQAFWAKTFHWINIVSVFVMLSSGLQIYNANPVFGGRQGIHIPEVFTLGGWLAGGRDWHFAGMTIFALNLLWYGGYILVTQRWRQRFVGSNDCQALKTGKNPKRKAYAWHRLIYTAIVPVLLLAIFSGIGMYKPAQFPWIVDLFGSWQALRIVHFASVPMILVFTIVHSQLGLRVGGKRLLESMF